MKITNTTDIPTSLLRQLTSWVLHEVLNSPDTEPLAAAWDAKIHPLIDVDAVAFVPASDHTYATYLGKGSPRRRNSNEKPGDITVHVARAESPGHLTSRISRERIFEIVIQLGAVFVQFGGPVLPDATGMGLYRQAVGAKWMAEADVLLAKWQTKGIELQDEKHRRRLQKALKWIAHWEKQKGYAANRRDIWQSRADAAAKALDINIKLTKRSWDETHS